MSSLTILGAGPAGLAAGFFARRRGWSVRILDASDTPGGNCRTLQSNGFKFDLGAHRFHDKDPEITAVVRALVGDGLREVSAPSAVCLDRRYLPFPPTAPELLRYLGAQRFAASAASLLVARGTSSRDPGDLEAYAVRAYGRPLAELFLLSYSSKLWGVPCSTLSPRVSGGRLRGLRLSTLLTGASGSNGHLEGTFLYPDGGYGQITTRLAQACGPDTIRTGARITRLIHDGHRITALEVNGDELVTVDEVVCTLPLGMVVDLLTPALPDAVRVCARSLRFRNLVLTLWCLDQPSVMSRATVYFPEAAVSFTRVSEPRNRSPSMAPPGQTSLLVETPCNASDRIWQAHDETIVEQSRPTLAALGWIDRTSVIGTHVARVPHAYPILTNEAEAAAATIANRLSRFENLHLVGRNGLFRYNWLHSVMRMAKTAVDGLGLRVGVLEPQTGRGARLEAHPSAGCRPGVGREVEKLP